jgi:hypothetical protein
VLKVKRCLVTFRLWNSSIEIFLSRWTLRSSAAFISDSLTGDLNRSINDSM